MLLIQVLRGEKWVSIPSIAVIKKGNVYRTRTGLNSWGEPQVAQTHARRRAHPTIPDVAVWVLGTMVETIKR